LSKCGDALRDHDQLKIEEYLEAVNLEAAVREGGITVAETLFLGELVIVGI